jgi:hypothetical protein
MNFIHHIRSLFDPTNKGKAFEFCFITLLVVIVIYLIGSGI